GRTDAHELGALVQLINGLASAVAHPGAQPSHQLIHQVRQDALVGYAAFDAFGNQFASAVLRVAVRRPLRHRAHRPHAAVTFERASLIENRFTGTLLGARQQAADHHAIRARGDGLGDVARIFDAAVGDHGDARTGGRLGTLRDSRDLRHARATHHARGADGAGPDADLDPVDA